MYYNGAVSYTDRSKQACLDQHKLGDVLNILYIINDAFYERTNDVFNPRNALYISKNDGMFNNAANHQRDTIINTQTLIKLSRKNYSQENIARILNIVNANK